MKKYEFSLMRSLIHVNCVREQYRVKLNHWLYYHQVPESISQFGPYVSKYAYYNALPEPPEGDRFGTNKMQLTEHYWMVNPMAEELEIKTYSEYFPPDVLVWQGNMPESSLGSGRLSGDNARTKGRDEAEGANPFIFAFMPVAWETDMKGKGRALEDGPNYRWQFMVRYPEGVPEAEGEKWLLEQVLPLFAKKPEVRRILTSKIIREVNDFIFDRVVEIWFEGPDQWHKCCVQEGDEFPKPPWAQQDRFPYLKPFHYISSIFLADNVSSDHYSMYRGFLTMR